MLTQASTPAGHSPADDIKPKLISFVPAGGWELSVSSNVVVNAPPPLRCLQQGGPKRVQVCTVETRPCARPNSEYPRKTEHGRGVTKPQT